MKKNKKSVLNTKKQSIKWHETHFTRKKVKKTLLPPEVTSNQLYSLISNVEGAIKHDILNGVNFLSTKKSSDSRVLKDLNAKLESISTTLGCIWENQQNKLTINENEPIEKSSFIPKFYIKKGNLNYKERRLIKEITEALNIRVAIFLKKIGVPTCTNLDELLILLNRIVKRPTKQMLSLETDRKLFVGKRAISLTKKNLDRMNECLNKHGENSNEFKALCVEIVDSTGQWSKNKIA